MYIRELGAGGGPTVFNLPPSIMDVPFVSAVLIGLIGLTIVLDALLHHLHHTLSKAKRQMLEKLKDELMVLGFLSFFITLLEQTGVHIPTNEHLLFEFAHMLVFFVAVALVLYTARLMRIESKITRKWDVLDTSQVFVEQIHLASQVDQILIETGSAPTTFIGKLLSRFDMSGIIRNGTEYHIARALFYEQHSLNQVFDFPMYLHRNLVANITQVLDVSKTSWLAIIVLICLNLIRFFIFESLHVQVEQSTLLFELVGMALIVLDLSILYIGQRTKDRFLCTMKLRQSSQCTKSLEGLSLARKIWANRSLGRSLTTIVSTETTKQPRNEKVNEGIDTNTRPTMHGVFRKLSIEHVRFNRKKPKKKRVHVVAMEATIPQNQEDDSNETNSHLALDYKEALRKTFPFEKPELYSTAVKTMVVLYSFYTALLAMYFMNVLIQRLYQTQITTLQCAFEIMVLLSPPMIHAFVISERIIRTWTILDSLIMSRPQTFEEVIQHTIDTNVAYAQLRGQFMVRYEFDTSLSIIDEEAKVKAIFSQFDIDNNGHLNYSEFSNICQLCSCPKIPERTLAAFMRLIRRDERSRAPINAITLAQLRHSLVKHIGGSVNGEALSCTQRMRSFFRTSHAKSTTVSFTSFQRFFAGLETVQALDKAAENESVMQVEEDSQHHAVTVDDSVVNQVPNLTNCGENRNPEPNSPMQGQQSPGSSGVSSNSVVTGRRHSNSKVLEKLLPYRKRAHMFAFCTKDMATFSKSWGDSTAQPYDYIMISTDMDIRAGRDVYCISAEEFGKNYELVQEQSNGGHEVRKKGAVFAQLMTDKFEVAVRKAISETGEEGGAVVMLSGQAGDFIVRPVGREPYIVAQQEFLELYERSDQSGEGGQDTQSETLSMPAYNKLITTARCESEDNGEMAMPPPVHCSHAHKLPPIGK